MPKPFMKIGGGASLLQRTALRARTLGADECLVVTNAEYTFKTVEEFASLGKDGPGQVQLLLEPVGRNTAPAGRARSGSTASASRTSSTIPS